MIIPIKWKIYIIHPWEPDFYLLLPTVSSKSKIERKGPTSTSQPQRLKRTKEPLKGTVIITPLSC